MLRSAAEMMGYILVAEDGTIGQCKDLLFDERWWTIRYMVADTGKWLPGRKVLISPISLGEPDWAARMLPVKLTTEQIKNSPPIEEDLPVSREYEKRFHNFFGYPYYWIGTHVWGYTAYPASLYALARKELEEKSGEQKGPNYLRSAKEVEGYKIHATDGRIGHVEDFLAEEKTWTIRYIMVDTRNWLPGGKKVLLSPQWASGIRWEQKELMVNLTKEAVKNSPEYDPSMTIDRQYESRLYDHYERPQYWS